MIYANGMLVFMWLPVPLCQSCICTLLTRYCFFSSQHCFAATPVDAEICSSKSLIMIPCQLAAKPVQQYSVRQPCEPGFQLSDSISGLIATQNICDCANKLLSVAPFLFELYQLHGLPDQW